MNKCDSLDLSPKRKIGVTRRSVSGIYIFRGETAIPHESTLERDFIVRNEFFLDVERILPQPIRIPFIGPEGRTYSYIPDFLVIYRPDERGHRRPLLVEVKPGEHWRKHWRKWRRKWKAAIGFAREHNWRFRIQDESRIRDTVLQNVRFLDGYKGMRPGAEDIHPIVELFRSAGPTPISTFLDQHCRPTGRSQAIQLLWHLVAVRKLDCDISGPLNYDTKLRVPHDR